MGLAAVHRDQLRADASPSAIAAWDASAGVRRDVRSDGCPGGLGLHRDDAGISADRALDARERGVRRSADLVSGLDGLAPYIPGAGQFAARSFAAAQLSDAAAHWEPRELPGPQTGLPQAAG
jgi:hypothetical protein